MLSRVCKKVASFFSKTAVYKRSESRITSDSVLVEFVLRFLLSDVARERLCSAINQLLCKATFSLDLFGIEEASVSRINKRNPLVLLDCVSKKGTTLHARGQIEDLLVLDFSGVLCVSLALGYQLRYPVSFLITLRKFKFDAWLELSKSGEELSLAFRKNGSCVELELKAGFGSSWLVVWVIERLLERKIKAEIEAQLFCSEPFHIRTEKMFQMASF